MSFDNFSKAKARLMVLGTNSAGHRLGLSHLTEANNITEEDEGARPGPFAGQYRHPPWS